MKALVDEVRTVSKDALADGQHAVVVSPPPSNPGTPPNPGLAADAGDKNVLNKGDYVRLVNVTKYKEGWLNETAVITSIRSQRLTVELTSGIPAKADKEGTFSITRDFGRTVVVKIDKPDPKSDPAGGSNHGAGQVAATPAVTEEQRLKAEEDRRLAERTAADAAFGLGGGDDGAFA